MLLYLPIKRTYRCNKLDCCYQIFDSNHLKSMSPLHYSILVYRESMMMIRSMHLLGQVYLNRSKFVCFCWSVQIRNNHCHRQLFQAWLKLNINIFNWEKEKFLTNFVATHLSTWVEANIVTTRIARWYNIVATYFFLFIISFIY